MGPDDEDERPTDEPDVVDEVDRLEEAGRESFPASDPPSWTLGVTDEDDGSEARRQ